MTVSKTKFELSQTNHFTHFSLTFFLFAEVEPNNFDTDFGLCPTTNKHAHFRSDLGRCEEGRRVWALFFIFHTITSVTFHVCNPMQRHEYLPGETVRKSAVIVPIFLSNYYWTPAMTAGFSPCLQMWPFRRALNIFCLQTWSDSTSCFEPTETSSSPVWGGWAIW